MEYYNGWQRVHLHGFFYVLGAHPTLIQARTKVVTPSKRKFGGPEDQSTIHSGARPNVSFNQRKKTYK